MKQPLEEWLPRAVELAKRGVGISEIAATLGKGAKHVRETMRIAGYGWEWRRIWQLEAQRMSGANGQPRGRASVCCLGKLTKEERDMVAARDFEAAMLSAMQRAGVPL